jgi:hypothetical protein
LENAVNQPVVAAEKTYYKRRWSIYL